MNMSSDKHPGETIAQYFRVLGQPIRIQILLLLGKEDACVCHLEAYLGIRQALISQHLMVLRDAGIVSFYRDGRNIFYQLVHHDIINVVHEVATILGLPATVLEGWNDQPVVACPCPRCNCEAEGIDCSQITLLK